LLRFLPAADFLGEKPDTLNPRALHTPSRSKWLHGRGIPAYWRSLSSASSHVTSLLFPHLSTRHRVQPTVNLNRDQLFAALGRDPGWMVEGW